MATDVWTGALLSLSGLVVGAGISELRDWWKERKTLHRVAIALTAEIIGMSDMMATSASLANLAEFALPNLPGGAAAKLRRAARLAELGASRELHLEGRAFAQGRLDPDAAAVHFHDLLGYCETEASTALCFGVGAVNLVELLEDARLMFRGDAGACVGHADIEVAIHGSCHHADLAGVRELDGVAN